ncbi:putative NBD/HSP70 family sugar kinase [Microbacterium terrae]|uniref:Glucokinase n=1 Tax=Microbacterium terrae TaxID=69369 RepID=A0A0M2H0K8_9MICO|nr:ROK family protein [Microbacterium terrae]KJL37545.1 Glucokinase [Microbacterium terrae]MBP1076375.1 putative NBD/HSP70 family sugar kinase [Microbacterium terrae]GLJ97199.1 N-acetylglucosamine kinase [Microbacterium terrae]
MTGGEIAVGLDVGGTKVFGVAIDDAGVVVASTMLATQRGEAGVLAGVCEAVDDLVAQTGGAAVGSIGIGIPGVVDVDSGMVEHSINLGLHHMALAARVMETLGVPTAVDNDVILAAVGEAARRPGIGSLSLLSIGTGFAAGSVIDGEPVRGSRGVAGEIGHLPVDPHGPVCGCGQRGCLELFVSGSGIARMWPVSEGHAALDLASRAAAGEPDAVTVFGLVIDRLAWAIQQVALSTDPECIVVGGGVAALGGLVFEPLEERLRRAEECSAFVASLQLIRRVEPGSGPETAAAGAARYGRRVAVGRRAAGRVTG